MCILFVYTNPHPEKGGYRLIIASNRDEFYNRPAKGATKDGNIIGGRDMEPGREGGMWLGLSLQNGILKFGALLNVTGESNSKGATSGRGPIVYNFLKDSTTSKEYFQELQRTSFSPFNLFTLEVGRDFSTAHHFSNCPESVFEYPGAQLLGFGNSTPKSPLQKVQKGKIKFEDIVKTGDKNQMVEELLQLLKCEDRNLPDPELQRRDPNNFEYLSSICVKIVGGAGNTGYGTRTHSIILVDGEGEVEFIEHTMKQPIDIKDPKWEVNVIKARL